MYAGVVGCVPVLSAASWNMVIYCAWVQTVTFGGGNESCSGESIERTETEIQNGASLVWRISCRLPESPRWGRQKVEVKVGQRRFKGKSNG